MQDLNSARNRPGPSRQVSHDRFHCTNIITQVEFIQYLAMSPGGIFGYIRLSGPSKALHLMDLINFSGMHSLTC